MPLHVLFIITSLKLHLPPGLLSSLCYVESRHKVEAVNLDDGSSKSLGVCQVKLKTAKWLGFKGTERDLMRPNVNIRYAGKYLGYQMKRYKGDARKAVIAYNRGNARSLYRTRYQIKVFNKWRAYDNKAN